MNDVTNLLREVDPLASEGAWTAAERHSVRRALLDAPRETQTPSRRNFIYGFAGAAATLVLIVVGSERSRIGLVAAVRFEVRLAEDAPGLELDQATVNSSGERVYLHRQAIVTNSEIGSAEAIPDANGSFDVLVTFTRGGAAKLLQATAQGVGRRLAILLDGQVVIAPTVRSPISTSAVISGGYTRMEADRIAAGIVGR